MVLRDGFEPPTPWSSTKRSTPELSKQMGHWHMPRINLLFNYQNEAPQPSLKQVPLHRVSTYRVSGSREVNITGA